MLRRIEDVRDSWVRPPIPKLGDHTCELSTSHVIYSRNIFRMIIIWTILNRNVELTQIRVDVQLLDPAKTHLVQKQFYSLKRISL